MGAIKEQMILWMEEEDITEEDLETIGDMNVAFFNWYNRKNGHWKKEK